MYVQQAIFTSARTRRLCGYQLVGGSPGLSREQMRELAWWGPAHNSLYDEREGAESLNFQRLAGGRYALSRTISAGAERSGRGGHRIYTQFFLFDPDQLLRYQNNPLSCWEAIVKSSALQVHEDPPEQLPPVQMADDPPVAEMPLEESCTASMKDRLLRLVEAARRLEPLAVVSDRPAVDLLRGVFALLPIDVRCSVSFTTGLRHSNRRPYQINFVPPDPLLQRRLLRGGQLTLVDVTAV